MFRDEIAQMCVHLPNNSYTEYWNMPRIDRDAIIRVWNKHVDEQKRNNK